jgi:hypothetical protein
MPSSSDPVPKPKPPRHKHPVEMKAHHSEGVLNSSHEAILQTLERKVGDIFLPISAFENVDAWKGIPIIYAIDHPEMDAWEADPEAELARIKGKIVGEVEKAEIDKTGHPKLKALLKLLDDPEIEAKIKEGKLSLSTGFWAMPTKEGELRSISGAIEPQHLLVFEEDLRNIPKDQGSMFLNKQGSDDEIRQLGRRLAEDPAEGRAVLNRLGSLLSEAEKGKEKAEQKESVSMGENENDEKMTSLEASLNKVQAEASAKEAVIEGLRKELEAFRQKEKDSEWSTIKGLLPIGMVHKEEDEKNLRKMMDEAPAKFIIEVLNKIPKPEAKASGLEFKKEKVEVKDEDALAKMGVPVLEIEDRRK